MVCYITNYNNSCEYRDFRETNGQRWIRVTWILRRRRATFFFKSVVPRVRWIKSYWKMYVGMSRHSVQYKCKSDQSARVYQYILIRTRTMVKSERQFPFHRYSTQHGRKCQSQNLVVEFNTKWMRFSRPALEEVFFFRDFFLLFLT